MGRLFLKLYSILVVSAIVFIIGITNLSSLLQGTMEYYFSGLSKGTFYLLENQMQKTKEEEWPALLENINQGGGYKLSLVDRDSLSLSAAMKERLEKGEMIVTEIYGANYSYTPVKNSEWVLEFPFEQSDYDHNQRLANSTFNLIEMRLQQQPQTKWNALINELSSQFSFPVSLLDQDHITLSESTKKKLSKGQSVWQLMEDEDIDFLYRRISNSPYIIKIGPFDAPLTLNYLGSILLLVLALLVAMAVLLWVYPLWRDLKRLGENAKDFGNGNFNTRVIVHKGSVVLNLAATFNEMADRIQKLISSHKELTNAVSHELRTPISRLKFGIEMLESASNKVDQKRYIEGMNTDIDELETLVSELLTYARFDRDRPVLKFQRQEIEPWLSEIIKKVKVGNRNLIIKYEINVCESKYAKFEPVLMARAVGNLLQNAKRYASGYVLVQFSKSNGSYMISVDDDGTGIPESEREHIFEAFKRLDESRDRETGGYGLGLAIVQRISQWHSGEVTILNSPLGGARFEITWPEEDDNGS